MLGVYLELGAWSLVFSPFPSIQPIFLNPITEINSWPRCAVKENYLEFCRTQPGASYAGVHLLAILIRIAGERHSRAIKASVVNEILGEPALYKQLTHLFEIKQFESMEIADKAKEVEALLERYAPAP